MLSSKNYQQIAGVLEDAIRTCEQAHDLETVFFITYRIVEPLTELLQQDNPKFNPGRFAKACGVRQEDLR